MSRVPGFYIAQLGESHRHVVRCETCGWQTYIGSLRGAQVIANEHKPGCPGAGPPSAELVPASTATVEPAGPWSGQQLEIMKRDLGIKTDAHLEYFAQVASHKGLDPFLGEIVPVYYGGEMVIQETVEGLRTIADRSGLYDGFIGPQWCGPDLVWKEVWLDSTPPAAARYFVKRKDWSEPASGVARWQSSVQLDRDGKPQRGPWRDRPDEMLGKTAEVRALKRAFPKEFARAGVSVKELSDAQVVAIEARRAGLDDDERHALVAEVTGGRTESTRDLTDAEIIDVRAEIARRTADDEPDAVVRTIARAAGNLEARLEKLDGGQLEQLKKFRRAEGLTRPLGTLTPEQRARIAAELDRRETEGWDDGPGPTDEEDTTADEDDVLPGDVVEPDLFDEPS